MPSPKLAEALNPRLAANRRMASEGQAQPAMPDQLPASAPSGQKFTRQWSPEERARQNAALAKILSERK